MFSLSCLKGLKKYCLYNEKLGLSLSTSYLRSDANTTSPLIELSAVCGAERDGFMCQMPRFNAVELSELSRLVVTKGR